MIRKYHSIEDIAASESFQNYCMGKDAQSIRTWNKYMKKYPEQIPLIKEARQMLVLFNPKIKNQPFPQKAKRNLKPYFILGLILFLFGLLYTGFQLFGKQIPIKQELKKQYAQENMNVLLPDGSKIALRKGAEISWKEPWLKKENREIWLNGEAFFEVKHRPDQGSEKFLAYTEHGVITVLGTSFLVNTTSNITSVFLEEGKIQYQSEDATYVLKPRDALFQSNKEIKISYDAPVSSYSLWRRKQLSFKNKQIKEIVIQLNNSYPITVQIGNEKLANKKITASISKNDPVLLLQAIAEIYEIKLVQNGNSFVLQ